MRRPGVLWRLLGAGVIGLGLAGVLWILARPEAPPPGPVSRGRVVLLSGRDDHGLLAQATVPLQRAPDDSATVARVRDGSFVRVLAARGTWMQVQPIAALTQTGWVDDYYLRDRALRTDGGGQVTFADARLAGSTIEVAVRPIDVPTAPPIWVPASLLREVGAK